MIVADRIARARRNVLVRRNIAVDIPTRRRRLSLCHVVCQSQSVAAADCHRRLIERTCRQRYSLAAQGDSVKRFNARDGYQRLAAARRVVDDLIVDN